MKNSWIVWLFAAGLVIVGLVVLNSQNSKKPLSLDEIFPDTKKKQAEIKYEYVDTQEQKVPEALKVSIPEKIVKPTPIAPSTPKAQPVMDSDEILNKVKASGIDNVDKSKDSSSVAIAAVAKEVDLSKVAFTIQIASFQDKKKTQKILDDLIKKNYPAYMISRNLGEKGIWYRVYVGQFAAKSEAEELLAKIKSDYSGSFIISPNKIQK